MTGASDHSAYCAELVREFDKDRYVAALFAPAHLRPALMTLYAFAVEIARVRSLAREILPGEIRLQWWRDALSGREHGGVAGNPVAAAMLDAIDAHDLPREVFDRFLDAHRMALYGEPPSSMTDLETQLDDTAGIVIALARQILGNRDPFDDITREAGRAEGLTGLLMEAMESPQRWAALMPRDPAGADGSMADQPAPASASREWRMFVALLVDKARGHLRSAQSLSRPLKGSEQIALLPLALISHRLDRIARGVNPREHALSPARRIWTLWRAARGLTN
jgi:phytoene synthase